MSNFVTMRLFVAMTAPEDIQERLGELTQTVARQINKEKNKIKWVQPPNFHLTLKFLGECEGERLPSLLEALQSAIHTASSFSLTWNGLGCFPDRGSPQVVWVGVQEGRDQLTALAAAIESALEPLGFVKENRPFSAHLTIGRVKEIQNGQKLRSLLATQSHPPFGTTPVNSLALVQSVLSSAGPHYTVLQTIPLLSTTSAG